MQFNALQAIGAHQAGTQVRKDRERDDMFKQAGNALMGPMPDFAAASGTLLGGGELDAGLAMQGYGQDQQAAQADKEKQGQIQQLQSARSVLGGLMGTSDPVQRMMQLERQLPQLAEMTGQDEMQLRAQFGQHSANGLDDQTLQETLSTIDQGLSMLGVQGEDPMIVGENSRVYDPQSREVLLDALPDEPSLPTGMKMGENGQPEWISGYLEGKNQPTPFQQAQLGMSRERLALDRQKFTQDQQTAAGGGMLSPEQVGAAGYPEGTIVQLDKNGGHQVRHRPQAEFTAGQKNQYTQQANMISQFKDELGRFKAYVNERGLKQFSFGPNEDVAMLDGMRQSLVFQAKNLFELGVLSKDDYDNIDRIIPDATGMGAMWQNERTFNAALQPLEYMLDSQSQRIPQQFRGGAAPGDAAHPPEFTPEEWEMLTPKERAEFQ